MNPYILQDIYFPEPHSPSRFPLSPSEFCMIHNSSVDDILYRSYAQVFCYERVLYICYKYLQGCLYLPLKMQRQTEVSSSFSDILLYYSELKCHTYHSHMPGQGSMKEASPEVRDLLHLLSITHVCSSHTLWSSLPIPLGDMCS